MVVNALYFSDGYGIKKINLSALVGESQSVVSTILSEPLIPSNKVSSMSGNYINSNAYLAASFDDYGAPDSYGSIIIKNETDIEQYSDNYSNNDPHISDKGILYLINETLNQIEVYYGAHFRGDTLRAPDFTYDEFSTPALFPGQILSLKVIDGASLRLSGGARLFVGTDQGLTRIETVDSQTIDGYSDGYDGLGLAKYYGTSTSVSTVDGYAVNKVIGGTASEVIAVDYNEEKSIILVCTNDNSNNGGITQISLEGDTQVFFMNEATGLLPSNDIRDITGGNL
jgi:hypothetical protein